MKDASGASQMDAEDAGHQPARRLDAGCGAVSVRGERQPRACCTSPAATTTGRSINVAIGAYAQPARRAGAGRGAGRARGRQRAEHGAGRGRSDRRAARARARRARLVRLLIDALRRSRPAATRSDESFDFGAVATRRRRARCSSAERARRQAPRRCWPACRRAARSRCSCATCRASAGHPTADAVLAAITHHARLGPADAQAHLAADRGEPAVVDAAVRHADRRLGAGRPARAGQLLRHRRPRTSCSTQPMSEIAFLALVGLDAEARRPVRVPDARGPAAVQRAGHDLGPGRQGRGRRRRPGGPGARAAEQGADRLSDAHRLRARRQRLRRHRLPDRAVPRHAA